MATVKILDERKFDYEKFNSDLKAWCKANKKSFAYVSQNVLFRSEQYLSVVFSRKALPANIALALAKLMQVDMKDYKVTKEEKKEVPAAKVEKIAAAEDSTGWSCYLKVDEEIGVAMLKIFKDGHEIATGRSYTYGGDDQGIVQGISYAAHMCYKMVEQNKLAHAVMEEEGVGTEADQEENPSVRVLFKDWIKKYEEANSKAGTLARYVSSHYADLPATGKKKIRSYLRLNNGTAHLITFDTLWDQYFKWCESNAVENNKRLGI